MVIEQREDNFFFLPKGLYEAKTFQIFFGFKRMDGEFYKPEDREYAIGNYGNEACVHNYLDDISANNGNYIYCPKLKIKTDSQIKINLSFGPKIKTTLMTRILKYIFPGIFFLGPTNTGGGYYKRDLRVEVDQLQTDREQK